MAYDQRRWWWDDSVYAEPDVQLQARKLEQVGPFNPQHIDWRSVGLATHSIAARAGGCYVVDLQSAPLRHLLSVDNEALQVRFTAAAARQAQGCRVVTPYACACPWPRGMTCSLPTDSPPPDRTTAACRRSAR
jgi:hypothetical protein